MEVFLCLAMECTEDLDIRGMVMADMDMEDLDTHGMAMEDIHGMDIMDLDTHGMVMAIIDIGNGKVI